MKRSIVIILTAVFCNFSAYSQNAKVKAMMTEIHGQYALDDNNQVTYVKIIDAADLSKKEIYNRAKAYFIYNYNSADAVIQEDDEDEGRIIGKGYFNNIHVGYNFATYEFDMYHILRVDVKDGRARIILSLTEYKVLAKDGYGNIQSNTNKMIANTYPLNPKGPSKTMYGKAFYNSHIKAQQTLNQMHDAILKGNTSESLADDNW